MKVNLLFLFGDPAYPMWRHPQIPFGEVHLNQQQGHNLMEYLNSQQLNKCNAENIMLTLDKFL